MLLAIDIGNTNIVIGLFKGDAICKRARVSTKSTIGNLKKDLSSILSVRRSEEVDACISSVVPSATSKIASLLYKSYKIKPIIIGSDIRVPIKNLYRDPKQVGQDRLVNAYACLKKYGKPVIIVDFGTATTFDYINKKGEYVGGLITPGVNTTIEVLAGRAALLPKIRLKKPKQLIGNDTVDSIRSGIVYGLAGTCDAIIERIKRQTKAKVKIIATGGTAELFKPYCKDISIIDQDLTLDGIKHVFDYKKHG